MRLTEATVERTEEKIRMLRENIGIEGQVAFSPDELAEIERHWKVLIRCYRWPPDKRLDVALRDTREPIPWWRLDE